jgi:tetratricopeptide (TPR) repeat protein
MEAEAGNTDEAIKILSRVAQRAEEHHLATVMRNALNNIAGCYHLANRTDEVIASAKAAERVAREAGSWRHLAPALALLANALLEKGLLAEARAAIDESVEIQIRVGSPHLGIALMRRAEILRRSGDRDSARRDAQHALERAVSEEEAMRVRTWLALDLARDGDAGSLKHLHDRIVLWRPQLERSPEGRQLLDSARALLGIT